MQNEMIQLTIANTLDQTAKQRVEVQGNQTLKQVVQQRNLAPNGSFDVYDQVGKVITNQAAANHRDATVYVGVAKVAGGGLKRATFDTLKRTNYPSMRHINQHSTTNTVGAFVVNLPGVYSHRDSSPVVYTLLVDVRTFPELPVAYVLTPQCADIAHANIYEAGTYSIAKNRSICPVCTGDPFKAEWNETIRSSSDSNGGKLGIFLDQLRNVLNSPNELHPARNV